MQLFLWLVLMNVVDLGVTGEDKTLVGCYSPQYIEIGTEGVIQCHFPPNFRAVYWFDNVTDESAQPTLTLRQSLKAGHGYDSGEFDVFPNGSLIITETSLAHEKTFKAVYIGSNELYSLFHISVIVTVSPSQIYPQISQCDDSGGLCFVHKRKIDTLSCQLNASRPASTVEWFIQIGEERKPVNSSRTTNDNSDATFDTIAKLYLSVSGDYRIAMFLCGSRQEHISNWKYKPILIDFFHGVSLASESPSPVYVPINGIATFQCPLHFENHVHHVILWKKYFDGNFDNVALWTKVNPQTTKIFDNEFSVAADGSLIIYSVKLHHEGNYTCTVSNFATDTVNSFQLVVLVPPSPSYIILSDCHTPEICTVASAVEGEVTCAVSGVRPLVSLKWSVKDGNKIHFRKEETSIKETAGLFSVSSTLYYKFPTDIVCGEIISVYCSAQGVAPLNFLSVRELELRNAKCSNESGDETYVKTERLIIAIVIFTLCAAAGFFVLLAVKKMKEKKNTRTMEEEHCSMEPLLDVKWKRKNDFVKELKTTYEEILLNAASSPWTLEYPELMHVYIPNELRIQSGNTLSSNFTCSPLCSYNELFEHIHLKERHILIEGGPGQGKTYLITHLISEWIKRDTKPILGQFDILISFSLKEMSHNKTVVDMIVENLMPSDFEVKSDDIEEIIRQNRCLILLDDFEQYPHRDDGQSEIHQIMAKNVLRNSKVILMTRPTYFTKKFGRSIAVLSMEGFTTDQINEYIQTFFQNHKDLEKRVKAKLHEDKSIVSMCKTPLFLCMSAYIFLKNPNEKEIFGNISTFFEKLLLTLIYPFCKQKTSQACVFDTASVRQQSKCIAKAAWDDAKMLQSSLKKDDLSNETEVQYFEVLVKTGVLTETNTTLQTRENVHYKFSHDLYRYFYGAIYLAFHVPLDKINDYLQSVDAYSCGALFLFTCGLSKNENVLKHVVQYLLEKDDNFPYPIRDCIIQCLFQIDCDNWIERRELVESLCRKEHALLMRYVDPEDCNNAKSFLMNVCSENAIPVKVLSFGNVLKEIHGSKVTINTADKPVNLPKEVKTYLIKDFQEVCEEKDVMFLLEYTTNLKEIYVSSTLKPSEPICKIICEKIKKNGTIVLWITLKKEKVVTISFPVATLGDWMTFEELFIIMNLRNRSQSTDISVKQSTDIPVKAILTTMRQQGTRKFIKKSKEFDANEAKDLFTCIEDNVKTIQEITDGFYGDNFEQLRRYFNFLKPEVYAAVNDEDVKENYKQFLKNVKKLEKIHSRLDLSTDPSSESNDDLEEDDIDITKYKQLEDRMRLLSTNLKRLLEKTQML